VTTTQQLEVHQELVMLQAAVLELWLVMIFQMLMEDLVAMVVLV
jgi:hypothetical protein